MLDIESVNHVGIRVGNKSRSVSFCENLGFGTYHDKYQSGREGDWPVTGFSPRKQNFTIYIMPGFSW